MLPLKAMAIKIHAYVNKKLHFEIIVESVLTIAL